MSSLVFKLVMNNTLIAAIQTESILKTTCKINALDDKGIRKLIDLIQDDLKNQVMPRRMNIDKIFSINISSKVLTK